MEKNPLKHPFKNNDKKDLVKQDNTSTIKMVKGGKRVCGSRTQNIHIRYFYAHERVHDRTVVLTYCPTKEMVRDYFPNHCKVVYFEHIAIPPWVLPQNK